jgi:hydroxymethylpyrimidine/phosphomethylpyrimidine kinase
MEKSSIENPKPKICLTIAGLDPSGGAGIIADIKTFSAFGCFATAAVASLTFQNTTGVFGAANQTAEIVRRQVEPVLQDFSVSAIKTGMLPSGEIIEEVARLVHDYELENFVVDPVVRSTSGFDLIDDAALEILIEKLFPLAAIVTPNLPEAERITKMRVENARDIEKAARVMQSFGARNVLIKGGHLPVSDTDKQNSENGGRKAVDFLFAGEDVHIFETEFIETDATHGTGCTLAAAIAANLARGKTLIESVETAKRFVTEAIRTAPHLGKGHSPVNHLISGF